MTGDPMAALLRRDRLLVWAGLAALTLGAWTYLLHLERTMAGMGEVASMPGMAPRLAPWTAADFAFTGVMWAVMMVGMMLPAAAPVMLLFVTVNRKRREQGGVAVPTAVFGLGYLLVWGGFSVGAALLQGGLHRVALLSDGLRTTSPLLGGGLLVAAGLYQLTPLKDACLARCRNPLGFLVTGWREGAGGALVMGVRHGASCLGCCGMLMGLLFVTGVMNLLWVAALAAFVLVEKVAPGGRVIGRLASGALVLGGLLVAGGAVG